VGGFSAPRLNLATPGPFAANGFLAPTPSLPTPSQVLNPVGMPGNPPVGLHAGMAPTAAQKPQVQNYFYTLPADSPTPKKNKNIKKFLLTTGAVVAGMFTTIGVAAGLLWFFYPGFIQLAQAVGGKNAQAAAKALSEWKKPGDLLTRFNNARKAFAQCKTQDAEHHAQSPYQRLKSGFFSLFQSEEQKLKAKAAQKATIPETAQGQGSEAPISGMLKEFKNVLAQVPQEDLKALEEKATQIGADSVSQAMASPENQKILTDIISKAISDKLSALPLVGGLVGRFWKK
jgi:hypothetical protein